MFLTHFSENRFMTTDRFCSLDDQHAVVTGASSGIGQRIAIELARAGAKLTVTYRENKGGAEETAQSVEQFGQKATIKQLDLSNRTDIKSAVDSLFDSDAPPNIWVNNAGADLLTGNAKHFSYAEKLRLLLDVDVQGTVLISKRVGDWLVTKGQGQGVIINTGWDQAERGMEGDSGELFATAKNAIMGFSRSLALSLAPNVRVNCIAPGWIRTAWGDGATSQWQERVLNETPLKRWGTPEDIANVVRYLCSEEASYITGQIYYVNGGAER